MNNNKYPAASGAPHTMERLGNLLREHAQDLFARILAAESGHFLERCAHLHDELGRDAVVRNGFQPERQILTGIGPVSLRIPKLRCRTGHAAAFRSNIVPRYVRRAGAAERESVWRYLYGIHGCDLNQVLLALLGTQAAHLAGLVPESVRRSWLAECGRSRAGSLAGSGTTELWADCIESDPAWNVAPGSLLIVIGADARGRARLLGLEHGIADLAARWMALASGLLARGLHLPARINLGAGAGTGFGRALETLVPVQAHREGSLEPRPGSDPFAVLFGRGRVVA